MRASLLLAVGARALAPSAQPRPPALQPLNNWLKGTCSAYDRVAVGPSTDTDRPDDWGLRLQRDARRGDVLLEVPLNKCLTAAGAYEGIIGAKLSKAEEVADEPFCAFCGDVALVALQLAAGDMAKEWADGMPRLEDHPLLMPDEPEGAPFWSSRSIEALRDNAREDYEWLCGNGVLEEVGWEEWKYCVAVAISRSVDLEGDLILAPGLDFCNHEDIVDPFDRGIGAVLRGNLFGADKKVALVAPADGLKGDEVRISYGALSAAEYLERYGFAPARGAAKRAAATCELRFEFKADERFVDDKVGLLERVGVVEVDEDRGDEAVGFEFKVGSGALDPELIKFLRLSELSGADAFLLEPVFQVDIWRFLDLPVSEENERRSLETVARECYAVAETLRLPCADAPREAVRRAELSALEAALEAVDAELGSLSSKEYYQERRLKELGLDTEWSQDDAQWSATRSPGSVDW
ncbi:hypothetical protein M885DRAFT_509564 [Pelagophyceae sp. CCMP2097]|nr:hypothetical protein M885DRAFT_509564 [Pelagophyceae sp. CCMP2097]|mmetsp:Transcript_28747/g.96874  ORF Transcript_28747/g.96874 Transcript_28747/m.96874 type:complete len:466 (-) Transcript_28747:55-1452(-)